MKNKFSEYYKYTDEQLENICNKCLFVFDTNVLLGLYRYKKKTSDEIIRLLKKIKEENRIWIPHQVGLEFHKGRIPTIREQTTSYKDFKDLVTEGINKIKAYGNEHPCLDLAQIYKKLDQFKKYSDDLVDKTEEEAHPNWMKNDEILDKLTAIFDGNVGEEFTKQELEKIYHEGEERYKLKIPPGYKDQQKKDISKYGDLVLWKQIIKKAESIKDPIVFITDERKEDWWLIDSGNTISPKPELRREIKSVGSIDFHMYTTKQFLNYVGKTYNMQVDKKTLEEINKESIFRKHFKDSLALKNHLNMHNSTVMEFTQTIKEFQEKLISWFNENTNTAIWISWNDFLDTAVTFIHKNVRSLSFDRNALEILAKKLSFLKRTIENSYKYEILDNTNFMIFNHYFKKLEKYCYQFYKNRNIAAHYGAYNE